MNIDELKKLVKAVKVEAEKVEPDEKSFYTKKRKAQVDEAIATALEDSVNETKRAIAVDNLIHLIANTRELKTIKSLFDASTKLSKFANDWIQEIYGDATTKSAHRDAEEIENKKKEVKKDEEEVKTDAYLKLIKEIGKTVETAKQVFDDTKHDTPSGKKEAGEKLSLFEKLMKKIKILISDDLEDADLLRLLRLVDKANNDFDSSIYSDITKRLTNKIAKFYETDRKKVAEKAISEDETIGFSLLLEYTMVASLSDKLQRLADVAKGCNKEVELMKIVKTLKQLTKNGMKDSDLILSQIEALEALKKDVKTTVKQEIDAVIKTIEAAVGDEIEKEELTEAAKSTGKRISTSYETWDDESEQAGETDDKGWKDEEGEEFSDDEDESAVKQAVKFLRKNGAVDFSASQYEPRGWYSTSTDSDSRDIRTGELTIYSFHLNDGWTDKEKKEIYDAITKKKKITESYYSQVNYLID